MKSKDQLENYHNLKDKLLKYMFYTYGSSFLEVIDVDCKFKAVYPTEIIDVNLKTHIMDILISTEDGRLIDIEFQSSDLNSRVLTRFFNYAHETFKMYEKKVESVIVLNKEIKEDICSFELNKGLEYDFTLSSLKDYNAEERLAEIEDKCEKKEAIDDKNIIKLALIALTNYKCSIEDIIIKSINLIKKLDIGEIDKKYIMLIIEVLYRNTAKKELEGELKQMLETNSTLLAQTIESYEGELKQKDKEIEELKEELNELKK